LAGLIMSFEAAMQRKSGPDTFAVRIELFVPVK